VLTVAGLTTAWLSLEKMRRLRGLSDDEVMEGFGMKCHRPQQSGQVLGLATIAIVVLMGFLALSVDVGLLWARRRQMQTVAEAATVAAAVCRHAAEDRGAAVSGGIRRAQSGASFDDDAGAQGKMSAEPLGKRGFPGVAYSPDAELAPPGAAGNTVDQNRLNPCRGRPFDV
jgi:hypothetical protein